MDINKILANGLPNELKNIQFGQIYIFPKLNEGLIEKNVLLSQYISSASNKLRKQSKSTIEKPVVFAIPTDNPILWDCIVCKIASNNGGDVIEFADTGSVLEMLYDYFGLVYEKASRLTMPERYKITPSDSHPKRKTFKSIISSSVAPIEVDLYSIQLLTNKKWDANLGEKKLLEVLWKIEKSKRDGGDFDYKKVFEKFEASRKKEYSLKIEIDHKKRDGIFNDSEFAKSRICHIFMVDENGNQEEIMMEGWIKAIYLLFIVYDKGILMEDFNDKQKRAPYEKVYKEIYEKLANTTAVTDYVLDYAKVSSARTFIKNSIANITQNIYLEKFCIEGFKLSECYIRANSKEIRDYVVDSFNLNLPS